MPFTTHFQWEYPTVGGDVNAWGTILNNTIEQIDAALRGVKTTADSALPKTGGDLSGNITMQAKNHGTIVAGGTLTLDLAQGNHHRATVSGTTWINITGAPANKASAFVLRLTNGGSKTLNWPTGVKWPFGVQPSLTTVGTDLLGFITFDGVTWDGILLSKDTK